MVQKLHPRLGLLTWDDAYSPGSTQDVELEQVGKYHGPLGVTTAGWVLKDNEIGVTIAGEVTSEGYYRGVTFVPRGMVKELVMVPATKKKRVKPSEGEKDGKVECAVV